MTRKTLTIKPDRPQHTSFDEVVERICQNCRLYDDEPSLCRKRHPYRDQETGQAVWPFVSPFDWCGDFKRRPVE